MKWVKASERKPIVKENQRVPVRMFGIYDTILFTDGWWCWLMGEQVNDVRVRSEDLEDIEWLDETDAARKDEAERWREQVRKLREGLDEADVIFAHLEDFTHGKEGEVITHQRGKIKQLLNETK